MKRKNAAWLFLLAMLLLIAAISSCGDDDDDDDSAQETDDDDSINDDDSAPQDDDDTSADDDDAVDAEKEALKQRLWDEALDVFEANRVESEFGLFHLPSSETYRAFFAWDSGWNVIALSLLDPESAYEELATIFSFQTEDGRIPHEVLIPGLEETDPIRIISKFFVRRQYDDQGRSRFIDPPSFLIAAEILYRHSGDERILTLLPAMEACVDYLLGPRDLFGDGLVSIIHPWESGTDSAPVFDEPMGIDISNPLVFIDYLIKYPTLLNSYANQNWDLDQIAQTNRFVFEDVGLNGLTAAGLMSMATLYDEAGKPDDADRCRQRAQAMITTMETVLWDDQLGFFYPHYDLETPKVPQRRSITGLAPLITGLVDEEIALRLIEDGLLSDDHFSGPHPVPFNSISEIEDHIPMEGTLLWRGHCIWINMNWIAARVAATYGYDTLAREITLATAEMVDREGFREFYDSRTGEGDGANLFTWPALVLDMIEEHGL